ncbi:MAG: DUF5808 domain-containing protein [Bryobacteraceae bacterium]
MDDRVFVSLLELALVGAVMLLLPHLSARGYWFGITVPPEFRSTDAARAALHRYHWRVSLSILVAALAVLYLAPHSPVLAAGLLPLLPFVAGMVALLRERSRVRAAVAVSPAGNAPAAPGGAHHFPAWLGWALLPFAFPLAAALYLEAHWDRIPARFPIHWGANGQPNGWAHRTAGGVYGPLLFASGLMLLMLLMLLLGLAMYYGSRHSPQMLAVLKIFIGVMYFLGLMFTGIGLMPVLTISPVIFVVAAPLFVIALLVYSFKCAANPALPTESTPDERWTLGSIYYNPRDPALFVQKRIGFGYTFNFGHRLSWVILAGFLAGVGGLIVFLLGALHS